MHVARLAVVGVRRRVPRRSVGVESAHLGAEGIPPDVGLDVETDTNSPRPRLFVLWSRGTLPAIYKRFGLDKTEFFGG